MFGTLTFAGVLGNITDIVTTTGVGPLILVGLVAGVAGAVLRTVKRSAK